MVDFEEGGLVALVGRNISVRRKQLSLRQDQVAEAIGVEPETVSRFERAAHAPALKTLEKLAPILGVTPDMLLRGDALPVPNEIEIVQSYLLALSNDNRAFVIKTFRDLALHLIALQAQPAETDTGE